MRPCTAAAKEPKPPPLGALGTLHSCRDADFPGTGSSKLLKRGQDGRRVLGDPDDGEPYGYHSRQNWLLCSLLAPIPSPSHSWTLSSQIQASSQNLSAGKDRVGKGGLQSAGGGRIDHRKLARQASADPLGLGFEVGSGQALGVRPRLDRITALNALDNPVVTSGQHSCEIFFLLGPAKEREFLPNAVANQWHGRSQAGINGCGVAMTCVRGVSHVLHLSPARPCICARRFSGFVRVDGS